MSISVTDTINIYDGNGSTSTIYPITFKFFDNDDIKVYADNTDITSSSTITGDGSEVTGGIQTAIAYAATVDVKILLDMQMDQPTILLETGPLPAKVIEESIADRLNMQIRSVLGKLAQSITFIPGTTPFTPLTASPNTIFGLDENNNTILIANELLTDIGAIDQAVADAQLAAIESEQSATASAASAAEAAQSAIDAFNAAISAKGFITISAIAMSAAPSSYPANQASVMAVNTVSGGGTWSYNGMVFTHVFTDAGFDTTYEQIYVPSSTTTGQYIKVRYGKTSGSTWSDWAEWTDALSKTDGGTVAGDTNFSGILGTANNSLVSIDPSTVLNTYDSTRRHLGENLVRPYLPDLTYTSTNGGSYAPFPYGWSELSTITQGDIIQCPFWDRTGLGYPSRYLTTNPNPGNFRDLVWGVSFSSGALPSGTAFKMSASDSEDQAADLIATDEGVQFFLGYSNLSVRQLRTITCKSGNLVDSGWVDVDWGSSALNDVYDFRFVMSPDGSLTFWQKLKAQEYTLIWTSTQSHPWTTGAYSASQIYSSFAKEATVGGSGRTPIYGLYYAELNT